MEDKKLRDPTEEDTLLYLNQTADDIETIIDHMDKNMNHINMEPNKIIDKQTDTLFQQIKKQKEDFEQLTQDSENIIKSLIKLGFPNPVNLTGKVSSKKSIINMICEHHFHWSIILNTEITAMLLFQNKKMLSIGGNSSEIYLFSINLNLQKPFTQINNLIAFPDSSPDEFVGITSLCQLNENQFAAGSQNNVILILSISPFVIEKKLNEHADQILVIVGLNNTNFLSGSYDHTVILWENFNKQKTLKNSIAQASSYAYAIIKFQDNSFAINWKGIKSRIIFYDPSGCSIGENQEVFTASLGGLFEIKSKNHLAVAYDNEKPDEENVNAIAIIEIGNEYKVVTLISNYGILTNTPPYSFSEFNNYLFYSSNEYFVQINIDSYTVERTIKMEHQFHGLLFEFLDSGNYIITDNIRDVKGKADKNGVKKYEKSGGISLFKVLYRN